MLKYKYSNSSLRWLAPCAFLSANVCLFGSGDALFAILFGIFINLSAILTFILLSIFPRTYYCFDEEGIKYFNRKNVLKWQILWEDVKAFYCFTVMDIPTDYYIEYRKDVGEKSRKTIHITYKQYCEIYDKFNLEEKFNAK